MCLPVCLFGFILFGTLWASWNWMSISFPTLEKFSATIFQTILILFCWPISLSETQCEFIMWMLLCFMLSLLSFKISLLSKILFLFCCSVWMSSIAFSSSSLIHSSTSSNLLLNPSGVFFSLVITSVWYFLKFSLYWSSHCCLSIFCLVLSQFFFFGPKTVSLKKNWMKCWCPLCVPSCFGRAMAAMWYAGGQGWPLEWL